MTLGLRFFIPMAFSLLHFTIKKNYLFSVNLIITIRFSVKTLVSFKPNVNLFWWNSKNSVTLFR